jgi:hypothetical protein
MNLGKTRGCIVRLGTQFHLLGHEFGDPDWVDDTVSTSLAVIRAQHEHRCEHTSRALCAWLRGGSVHRQTAAGRFEQSAGQTDQALSTLGERIIELQSDVVEVLRLIRVLLPAVRFEDDLVACDVGPLRPPHVRRSSRPVSELPKTVQALVTARLGAPHLVDALDAAWDEFAEALEQACYWREVAGDHVRTLERATFATLGGDDPPGHTPSQLGHLGAGLSVVQRHLGTKLEHALTRHRILQSRTRALLIWLDHTPASAVGAMPIRP